VLGSSGLEVSLDISLPMSDFDTCLWDFGDGQQEVCTLGTTAAVGNDAGILVAVTHVYAIAGEYTVSITATNRAGVFRDQVTVIAAAEGLQLYLPMVGKP
jgi:hypothetical protein